MDEKYNIVSQIGQGGQAKVFLVQNIKTMNVMAMKEYLFTKENESGKEEALRELRVLRELKGKGIPYLVDCIEEKNCFRIIMEFVQGMNLREYMNEKHIFSQKEVLQIGMEILSVLSRFHGKNPMWIYGDLKPENIMITPEKEVYFVDFGSVIFCDDKNQKVYGTKEYLNQTDFYMNPQRDLYAFGMILFEMLVGKSFQNMKEEDSTVIDFIDKDFLFLIQELINTNQDSQMESLNILKCREKMESCLKNLENFSWDKKRKFFLKKKRNKKKDYLIFDKQKLICCQRMENTICILLFICLLMLGISYKTYARSSQNPKRNPIKNSIKIESVYVPMEEIGTDKKIQNKNNEYLSVTHVVERSNRIIYELIYP